MDDGASLLSHLECARCRARHDAERLATVCPSCSGPLLARYDLATGRKKLNALTFGARPNTMWRYRELLPVRDERHVVTLGEGSTPLLHLARTGEAVGLRSLLLKDEGRNPTGTIKARGMSAALSRAQELGARRFAVPSAGNAGAALAAYAAAAGLPALVAMPRDAAATAKAAVELHGAELALVDGTIVEAQDLVAARFAQGTFDLRSLHEPYRVEGKKTVAFEIAEALGWTLPDVVVTPAGDGAGLLGLAKGFDELEGLGLVGSRRPRLVAVQPAGCAPVVEAFEAGRETTLPWAHPRTVAGGVRVPDPFGGREILGVLRATRGTAVAVSDGDIHAAVHALAAQEGVLAMPEGAAAFAALRPLRQRGWIDAKETVVVVNTGDGGRNPPRRDADTLK